LRRFTAGGQRIRASIILGLFMAVKDTAQVIAIRIRVVDMASV
jgi:hypothetical protein